jgi:RNA polymerase sigma factor for flagellar operon FliA
VETYRADLEQLVHVTIGALDQLDHKPPTAGEDSSPLRQAERREIMDRIKVALTKLDQRDVLILSLYYNEELTYVEIGEVLGVTTSRVCQLHGRAIARLRTELETTPPAHAGRDTTPASPTARRNETAAAVTEVARG